MYFLRFFILLLTFCNIETAKILCIFPTLSKSHFIVASILCNSLAAEGHKVTIISPYTQNEKLNNCKNIQIHVSDNGPEDNLRCTSELNSRIQTIWEDQLSTYCNGLLYTNLTFQDCTIRKLINTHDKKFDLIIMDANANDALLGFGHRFSAPVVVVSMSGATSWTYTMGGILPPLSMVSNHYLGYSGKMSIFQRILNILMSAYDRLIDYSYVKQHQILFNEYFPNCRATLDELRANVSLILLNDHFTLSYPKPSMPNMIEVGGLHIKPVPDRLPIDIESFVNSSADGFIYFSMGADLETNVLPEDKLEHIVKVFGCIKQNILWKYEENSLYGIPDNVLIKKWFPQQDILANNKIKILITNGGTLSLMEAVYYKVPVIGIPIHRNHIINMERAVQAGFAISLDYDKLTSLKLGTAINNILTDPKYKQKITTLYDKFADQPLPPLETAIYWIEYVLRHQGAKQLKSITKNFSFIEYHNLDAYFILTAILLILLYQFRNLYKLKSIYGKKKKEETKKYTYNHMYPQQRFAYK